MCPVRSMHCTLQGLHAGNMRPALEQRRFLMVLCMYPRTMHW